MRYIAKIARQALTDNLWEQLQATMKAYGCYQTKNSREDGGDTLEVAYRCALARHTERVMPMEDCL